MEEIKIVFLGTGSAIPTLTRNHTSIYFKYKDKNILIDCGEGTQRQLRKAKISPAKITDILITHFHGDHVLGLPAYLHTLSKSDYKKTLNIYCPPKNKKLINNLLKASGVKDIDFKITEVDGKFIENKYFKITALPLEHNINCNGYMFEEKDILRIDKKKLSKLKIKNTKEIGKLIEKKNIKTDGKLIKWKNLTYLEKGRKISFILDTKMCNNVKRLLKNSNLAISEATFLEADNNGKQLAERYNHLTLEQITKEAKSSKVLRLVLTHISERNEFKEKKLLSIAKKIFKKAEIAKDLMKIEV